MPEDRTGRDGSLEVAFARRGGRTVLTHRRCRAPLQVLEPLALEDDPAAWLVLLNPGGGVLGGDHLHTEIELGEGAHVGVTTPSATRVYRSAGEASVLETVVRVGRAATLEYVPDHLIPQAGARLRQSLRVDLDDGARALVWDAVAVARPARAEDWAFTALDTALEVTRAGRPLFVDRACLARGDRVLAGRGGAENRGYLGLFLVLDPALRDPEALAAELGALLEEPACGGASVLGAEGCVARVLTRSASELAAHFRALWSCARWAVLGRHAPDLRKG